VTTPDPVQSNRVQSNRVQSDPVRLDAVLGALSDATRRQTIETLLTDGPTTATALARDLPISRQAVVKHLQVLDAAGLVESVKVGREVRFRANTAPLGEVSTWIDTVGEEWDDRLERLARRARR
jgi:DNA-binding transcriptional ArsR family regulator